MYDSNNKKINGQLKFFEFDQNVAAFYHVIFESKIEPLEKQRHAVKSPRLALPFAVEDVRTPPSNGLLYLASKTPI